MEKLQKSTWELTNMFGRDEDHNIDEYIKYAKGSKGLPEDFEDWAVDNKINLPPKKKRSREEYDDSE